MKTLGTVQGMANGQWKYTDRMRHGHAPGSMKYREKLCKSDEGYGNSSRKSFRNKSKVSKKALLLYLHFQLMNHRQILYKT